MGGKYVRMLEKQVRKLRDGQHGNRQLFLDELFIALWLAFFNATICSLQTIEDFSQTRHAQQFLSVTKICRSSMSRSTSMIAAFSASNCCPSNTQPERSSCIACGNRVGGVRPSLRAKTAR